jgi:hypothetical protein
LQFPFLGTVALDIKKGDDAYEALSAIYGNPEGEAMSDQVIFWCMPFDTAKQIHADKQAMDGAYL